MFGVVVGMYTKTVDESCTPQTFYSVLWDSCLYPVPHLQSEITQTILGTYNYNQAHHDVRLNVEKQKLDNDAEIARKNDTSIVREQCVRIMKKNPVLNEILLISERGIRKKNEDRIIKDRQQFPSHEKRENIEIVDERNKPVWQDSIVTCHYFTHDSPVFSDNSTCSPFKHF